MLKEWICGICISAMIVSIAKAVTPQNPSGKIIPIVGALIMILSVTAPVLKVSLEDVIKEVEENNLEYEWIENEFKNTNEKLSCEIIEDKMSSYIFERAERMGAECASVDVKVEKDKQGRFCIDSVKIILKKTNATQDKEKLREILISELSIPEKRMSLK